MNIGTLDPTLVLLSIMIAIAASYTALDLAGRMKAARSSEHWAAWLFAAAFAMGGGIWSMHFVAMLAFSIPGMQASYDFGLTLLSLLLAIAVTGIGFLVVARHRRRPWSLPLSGALMGAGIAGMHYTGMAAMRMPAALSYGAIWVSISIFIAIGASTVALWVSFARTGTLQRIIASVFMGGAIAGMHYAGMMAASYEPMEMPGEMRGLAGISQPGLAAGVALTTFFILALGLVASIADRRFAHLAASEAEALRASEERFRSLYRETPMPLFSMDAEGTLTEVSNSSLALLRTTRSSVVGRRLEEFMIGDSPGRWLDTLKRLLDDAGRSEEEYCFKAADGTEMDVMTSAQVFRSAGSVLILGGLIDITARKRAEAALRQSQKLEAVGQLTGGVAHDFNNLLSVVIGSLEILKKRLGPDSPLNRLVESAMEAGTRGATLTQRMLSFARRQKLDPKPVDVGNLVRGMLNLLQRSIGPRHQIELRLPDDPVIALVDAHQLELALLNLVVNARDAIGDAGTIVIAAQRREPGGVAAGEARGHYAVLSVIDHGTGMDAETLAKAADPFFTTKGVSKGTGLGLSMVHGFVEQSSGWMDIASTPDKGTTVSLWLPATDAEAAPTHHPEIVIGGASKSLRILAVDDDALVLFSTVSMLEDLGHQAQAASSGEEALAILGKDSTFDAIVTDQGMPGMTGLELARRLAGSGRAIPVLIATGYAELPDRGATPTLDKPFGPAQLERALQRLLSSERI
jgi:PAS domain S-box-containing protein